MQFLFQFLRLITTNNTTKKLFKTIIFVPGLVTIVYGITHLDMNADNTNVVS
jgi:hypothetical protein